MSELEDARYRLYTAIEEFGVYEDPNEIHDIINDYAHALAEWQRAEAEERRSRPVADSETREAVENFTQGMRDAADLIDPRSGT